MAEIRKDILVDIPDVDGTCAVEAYRGHIECISMRHSVDHIVKATGGRKTGTSRHGAIELTHFIDKASPKLHQFAAGGNNKGTSTITRTDSDGVVETITLSNTYIVRVDVDTPLHPDTLLPDDQAPVETFALEYSQIQWQYSDGNVGGTHNTVST